MGSNGQPFGRKRYAFQVVFFDEKGPFLSTLNDFPGRDPIVRVDEHEPLIIPDKISASTSEVVRSLVHQLRTGQVARVRYHVWPKGSQDMIVDLAGFDEAWQRLLEQLPKPQRRTHR